MVEQWIVRKNGYLHDHPRAQVAVALREVQQQLTRLKIAGWLTGEAEGRTLCLTADVAAQQEAARLDGCYVLKTHLPRTTQAQGRIILALDGLQPDVGPEVLWVLRDCLSGAVLLARSLLSATQEDLAALLTEVQQALRVPIAGGISDGQLSIRRAVAHALPEVPHQRCHFHYLHEAAKPLYEADRHAKKELKKRVRGVRPIERRLAGQRDPAAEVVRGYCAAVRSALTDEGRPPLDASGRKLHARLTAIAASLERVEKRGAGPRSGVGCRPC